MPNYDSAGNLRVDTEGQKATYSMMTVITMYSGMVDMFGLYGSPTKTVKLQLADVQITNNVGEAYMDIQALLMTSGNVGGTVGAIPIAVHDPSDPAATASGFYYSSGFVTTRGANNGMGRFTTQAINSQNTGTSLNSGQTPPVAQVLSFDYTKAGIKQPTFRNPNQGLTFISQSHIPLSGTTLAYVRMTWTEETNLA